MLITWFTLIASTKRSIYYVQVVMLNSPLENTILGFKVSLVIHRNTMALRTRQMRGVLTVPVTFNRFF